MRISLWTLLLMAYVMTTQAQNVVFADPNFKACLVNPPFSPDTNNDGEIQVSEANAALVVFCPNKNISDLAGIENFQNILNITVHDNNITTLDLSNSPIIQAINVQNNQLTNLTLASNNDDLLFINASNNQLANITFPANNDTLGKIYLQNNQLTSLTLPTNLPELDTIDVTNNQLTNLSLGNNYPKLISVLASNNQLSSLDVSNGVDLRDVLCNNNQLTSLTLPPLANMTQVRLREVSCTNNQFTSLSVSTPAVLLDCGHNSQLDSLWIAGTILPGETVLCDSSNLVYIGSNEELEVINCSYNRLEKIYSILSQNNNLKELDCSHNQIDTIVTGNTGMVNFNCSSNQLKVVDIANTGFVSNTFDSRNNSSLYCIATPDYLIARGSWLVDNQTAINDKFQCNGIWSSTTTLNNLPAVTLYPNPTSQETQLDLGQVYTSITVQVYTTVGQLVQQYQATSTDLLTIPLPKEKGLYLLQLSTEKGNQTFKVIKE